MIVYRIGASKYAWDLSGEGARLNGGRWNHKLIPCVYTSQNQSLALLEYTVNVNIENIPRALCFTTIEIPNIFLELHIAELPGNWKDVPPPNSTKDCVSKILRKAEHAVIKIPSSIVPLEFNYILNPLHKHFGKFKILDVKDFVYDIRIKMT